MCGRHAAVQFGAAQGGSGRRANGPAAWQLVRAVRPYVVLTGSRGIRRSIFGGSQGFGSNVSAVWPAHRAACNKETFELAFI